MEIMSFVEMMDHAQKLWPMRGDLNPRTMREEAMMVSVLEVLSMCMQGVKLEMEGAAAIPTLVTRLLRENEDLRSQVAKLDKQLFGEDHGDAETVG